MLQLGRPSALGRDRRLLDTAGPTLRHRVGRGRGATGGGLAILLPPRVPAATVLAAAQGQADPGQAEQSQYGLLAHWIPLPRWRHECPAPLTPARYVTPAAFEQPRNEVREIASGSRSVKGDLRPSSGDVVSGEW